MAIERMTIDETLLKLMEISEKVHRRIKMFGVAVDDTAFEYSLGKSMQTAADYCNLSGAEYFPKDAEIYLVEYAASEYLLEMADYHPKYEKMRKDAEIGLLRFRRMRW